MPLIFGVLGLMVGSGLNWAADVLPRFAVDKALVPPNLQPHFQIAVVAAARTRRLTVELAVEVLTAGLFALAAATRGPTWSAVWLAMLIAVFMLIAVIDLKYRLVLNIVIYPALALVLLLQLSGSAADFVRAVIGAAFGLVMFLVVAWLRPGELGGGDVKLAALLGLLFGFPDVLWALIIGVFAGGAVAIGLVAARRRAPQTQMPYAPFLCLGALIALFYNPLIRLFTL